LTAEAVPEMQLIVFASDFCVCSEKVVESFKGVTTDGFLIV
jgi:hypothetical protein